MPKPGQKVETKKPKKTSAPKKVHDFSPGDLVLVVNARGTSGPFRIEYCQPQNYVAVLEGYGRCHIENLRKEGEEEKKEVKDLPEGKDSPSSVPATEELVDFPPKDDEPAALEATSSAEEPPTLQEIFGGVNPEDHLNLRWQSPCGNYFVLHMLKEKESADYFCVRLDDNLFRVTKLDPEEESSYIVRIGKEKSCWCKGWRIRGECRHVAALMKLREAGRIS